MYREETLDPADPVFESWFTERGLWVQPPQDTTELLDNEDAMQAIADCLAKLPAVHRSVFPSGRRVVSSRSFRDAW
jgi:DNA-directed RNA polymerase specialized sigma24 family protein